MRPLNLTSSERAELIRRAAAWPRRGREARRARVILLLAERATWAEVMQQLGCSRGFVARWLQRFLDARVGGLLPHHHGSAARVITARLRRRIVEAAGERTAAGVPRWSTRRLGARLGVSHMTVQRIWGGSDVGGARRRRP
jgi:transposase